VLSLYDAVKNLTFSSIPLFIAEVIDRAISCVVPLGLKNLSKALPGIGANV